MEVIKELDDVKEIKRKVSYVPRGNSIRNSLPALREVHKSRAGKANLEAPKGHLDVEINNYESSSGSSTLTYQHEDTETKRHSPQNQSQGEVSVDRTPGAYMSKVVEDKTSATNAKEKTTFSSQTKEESRSERKPTLLRWHSEKMERNVVGEEKAQAMESLLELCAQLLKRERLEELAGVLKPFGEEAVSSRETAIWLTKGLMKIQKDGET